METIPPSGSRRKADEDEDEDFPMVLVFQIIILGDETLGTGTYDKRNEE